MKFTSIKMQGQQNNLKQNAIVFRFPSYLVNRIHSSHHKLEISTFSRRVYNKQKPFNQMPNNSTGQRMQLFIRLDNGNGCQLVVEKRQTLEQLVNALNGQDIELPPTYRILFKGRHINDYAKSLEELGITQKSILHVEEVEGRAGRPVRMDVCIFWQGEKYIVKSESREKILQLKQSIHRLLRVAPKDQLLVFKGYILQNGETLQHYRITPDSLICLHSAKPVDEDDVHSDYEQADEGFPLKENELLESVLSLGEGEKRSGVSRSTLFRSDSMGMKNLEEAAPYEIEIHYKGTNDDNLSESEKEFNFDLFKSFGMSNPMTLSIGYNLFDSLKHPVDRFAFKTFEIKSQDEEEFDEREEIKCDSLAESVTSFENVS